MQTSSSSVTKAQNHSRPPWKGLKTSVCMHPWMASPIFILVMTANPSNSGIVSWAQSSSRTRETLSCAWGNTRMEKLGCIFVVLLCPAKKFCLLKEFSQMPPLLPPGLHLPVPPQSQVSPHLCLPMPPQSQVSPHLNLPMPP